MNNLFSNILYISHGGGPLPLLGEQSHRDMVQGLRTISSQIKRPEAIIVISAHWETESVEIINNKAPKILYDFAGFPPEAYSIEYPAPGFPELASEVYNIFKSRDIHSTLNNDKGFDLDEYRFLDESAKRKIIQVILESGRRKSKVTAQAAKEAVRLVNHRIADRYIKDPKPRSVSESIVIYNFGMEVEAGQEPT